jgi:peptide/nickel transport system permease protein
MAFTTIAFFLVLMINFMLPRLMPGSPIDRFLKDPSISEKEREALLRDFGLDQPLHVQFVYYMTNTLRGNLGISFRYYPNPVMNVIIARIPWTLYLLGISYSLSVILGVILGAIAGWRQGSKIDISATGLSIITRSMPVFWFGMMLLLIFSFYFEIFPSSGAYTPGTSENIIGYILDVGWHSILPILTITFILFGAPALLTRNLVADILSEQYIYVAKCKGLPSRVILFKHALKNIMLPISSYTATLLGYIVSGAVFTETVFSWPGVGRLFYEAILTRDYPLIQGCLLLTTISVLLANFFADIFYSFLDPRVRQ